MTESTSNHNWTIPEVGGSKDTWGQILNDFFDDELDEEVSLKGPFSERPSAGSGVAKLYLATDRRIVYYNDGSSWEAVYGLGTEDNPVPNTSHFESIQAEDLDVSGRPSQDHRELVDFESVRDYTGTVEVVADGIERDVEDDWYVIEILQFDGRTANENGAVNLTVEGLDDGDYDYLYQDEFGDYTRVTGDDSYPLVTKTSGSSREPFIGQWQFGISRLRFGLWGDGTDTEEGEGEILRKSLGGDTPSAAFNVTISAELDDGSIDWAIWRLNRRSEI